MPAKSAKQYRLMQAVANGAAPMGKDGPSESVAKEFVKATPAKKKRQFSKQGPGSRIMRDE